MIFDIDQALVALREEREKVKRLEGELETLSANAMRRIGQLEAELDEERAKVRNLKSTAAWEEGGYDSNKRDSMI